MAGKGHKSGEAHPGFKHGRYVGEKSKIRRKTPRSGLVKAIRAWLICSKEVGSDFFTAEAQYALEGEYPPLAVAKAMANLRRTGEVAWVPGSQTLNRVMEHRHDLC